MSASPEGGGRLRHWRLPSGHYLEEERDVIVLHGPDGAPIAYFSDKRALMSIIEEIIDADHRRGFLPR